jgi:hypothetical protein
MRGSSAGEYWSRPLPAPRPDTDAFLNYQRHSRQDIEIDSEEARELVAYMDRQFVDPNKFPHLHALLTRLMREK